MTAVRGHGAVRALLAIVVTCAALGLAFPDRSDYLGHHLAGFAATLMLLSFAYVLPAKHRPTFVVISVFVAIALGWGTQSTIFKLAIFDPVDFNNQSLGAVIPDGPPPTPHVVLVFREGAAQSVAAVPLRR